MPSMKSSEGGAEVGGGVAALLSMTSDSPSIGLMSTVVDDVIASDNTIEGDGAVSNGVASDANSARGVEAAPWVT